MDTPVYLQILAIFVLLLANGFFALSEFSVIASRRSRLKQNVEEGKRGAQAAERLNADPDEFLASVQVGITLVGTLAGVFGGATIVEHLESFLRGNSLITLSSSAKTVAVIAVTVLITTTSVVIGELVPKYLALSNPERFARLVAGPLQVFTFATRLFSQALSWIANMVVRLLGVRSESTRQPITEDEINLMILEGRQKGVFDETEERLIRSVFDFADSPVSRAMTPRTDVAAIEINTESDKVIAMVVEHGHSRFPVYDGTIDNVIGILYVKDLILHKMNPELIILRDMIRKPTFVPDSMPLSQLLSKFRRKKGRIAIVLDEFGGTAGIVCLQDIIEEIVGEIQDEDDTSAPELVRHSDNTVFADGMVWPGAVNELINSQLPEENVDTLAGLIIDSMGRFPKKDEQIEIADVCITVLEASNNRLTRLKIEKTPGPASTLPESD